jgi:hypothetical protein
MLSLEQLRAKSEAYKNGNLDFDGFEAWFQIHAWGSYDRRGEAISDVIADVVSLLAAYESGEIEEDELRQELANAVHPFAASVRIKLVDQSAPAEQNIRPVEAATDTEPYVEIPLAIERFNSAASVVVGVHVAA